MELNPIPVAIPVPNPLFEGFSSSHTRMKSIDENTLLEHSTSVLKEGFFCPSRFEKFQFFYRNQPILSRGGAGVKTYRFMGNIREALRPGRIQNLVNAR